MNDAAKYPDLPETWVVCNCSVCGCLLSGRSMRPYALDSKGRTKPGVPPVVSGTVGGRPACSGCREPREARSGRARAGGRETPGGWDELFRAAEGGGQ